MITEHDEHGKEFVPLLKVVEPDHPGFQETNKDVIPSATIFPVLINGANKYPNGYFLSLVTAGPTGVETLKKIEPISEKYNKSVEKGDLKSTVAIVSEIAEVVFGKYYKKETVVEICDALTPFDGQSLIRASMGQTYDVRVK